MGKIYYCRIDETLSKEQIFELFAEKRHIYNMDLREIIPNEDEVWLTEGLQAEFDNFIPLGTKEGKAAKGESEGVIFKVYSGGVKTNRDTWAYNFDHDSLAVNMQKIIKNYNSHVLDWATRENRKVGIDDFVSYDSLNISWDSTLKNHLQAEKKAKFSEEKIRISLYRPFVKKFLFFDRTMNNSVHRFYQFFPTPETENENRVICLSGVGSNKPFHTLIVSMIPCLDLLEKTQCFPYYTYTENGRQENITDWTLKHFQENYELGIMNDKDLIHNSSFIITKWDIFYYVYGLLHHPHYRAHYAANLRRELPRIPLANDFWAFSQAGQQLAELHLNYEQQPEYPLQKVATHGQRPHYRIEKMRLTQEKDAIIYNEALTLKNIPQETFKYRLGNRSALEWIIDDQYQVKIDGHSGSKDGLEWINAYQAKTEKGSGILNDPNRADDEQYILRLIGQVITVSLETAKIVDGLPELYSSP